jgi:cytoskeletal protein RodZ
MDERKEEYRRRIIPWILVFLVILLVAAGLASLIAYTFPDQPMQQETKPLTKEKKVELSQLLRNVLYLLGIIIIIFMFGLWAILRWSRRFRQFLFREPRQETPVEDVWAMHRLPEEPDTFEPGDQDEPGQNEQE